VKFRRKSAQPSAEDAAGSTVEQASYDADEAAGAAAAAGPYDVDDLPEGDGTERVDLGSLLIAPADGLEVQLQVDEETETVQAVMVAGPDGALELRAFAAPRGGDLWSEVRPQIAADFAQRGGTATEREGRFGTELLCQLTVRTPEGQTGTQVSRIIGVNGPRWLLRATLLGRPAQEPESADGWEDVLARVAVRRGAQAMPVGAALPVELPPRDRLIQRPNA
jgi:hypothetical protein